MFEEYDDQLPLYIAEKTPVVEEPAQAPVAIEEIEENHEFRASSHLAAH